MGESVYLHLEASEFQRPLFLCQCLPDPRSDIPAQRHSEYLIFNPLGRWKSV